MSEIVNKETPRVASFFRAIEKVAETLERVVANQRPPFGGEHFLTDKEVSQRLKVSRRTLQDWRSQGKIAYIQLSGKVLYRASDIERLLMSFYHREWA